MERGGSAGRETGTRDGCRLGWENDALIGTHLIQNCMGEVQAVTQPVLQDALNSDAIWPLGVKVPIYMPQVLRFP